MQLRKKSKPVAVTGIAKLSPYIKRAAQDPRVLAKGQVAVDSGRSAYGRIRKQKASAPAMLNDKKLQRELGRAVEAMREASVALTAAPTERRRRRLPVGFALLGLIAAGIAAFIFRDKLRAAVSGDATSTADQAGPYSSAETGVASATPVAPPSSPATAPVPPSPADGAND
jgi:hypothetical protein